MFGILTSNRFKYHKFISITSTHATRQISARENDDVQTRRSGFSPQRGFSSPPCRCLLWEISFRIKRGLFPKKIRWSGLEAHYSTLTSTKLTSHIITSTLRTHLPITVFSYRVFFDFDVCVTVHL